MGFPGLDRTGGGEGLDPGAPGWAPGGVADHQAVPPIEAERGDPSNSSKPLPVIVTAVPPSGGPWDGSIAVICGAATYM